MHKLLILLLVVGCTSLKTRNIASEEDHILKIWLSQELTFANGANSVDLFFHAKNHEGGVLPSLATEFIVSTSEEVVQGKSITDNGIHRLSLRPKVKSPDIDVTVNWKGYEAQPITLKTTLAPLKDAMAPLRSQSSNSRYVSNLSYSRQDAMPEGQFESFDISNDGKNSIVSVEESGREFEFNFDEHARQNISLMVTDTPTAYVSHSMHSHFMFFPRKVLPYAEHTNDGIEVTLPTGETMVFKKSGELKGGVFDEGPVDTGPDRFKRSYADLKYRGKGILLRANARGQMPQQGQFESTKIDMEFGIRFSADVLILNGTTGQRCRRPKTDFWPSGDVSPILFKFPTDEAFDAYLKLHCKFGIPEI